MTQREYLDVDIVIVGAGPSGLSAACRVAQIAKESGQEISITVLEKGSEVGAHIISGAVMDIKSLDELFPNWKQMGAPITTEVNKDEVYYLTRNNAYKVPGYLVPSATHNKGKYVVSLGEVCRWLALEAENLGVDIYPGFAAVEILYDEKGSVVGVVTGEMGVDKNQEKKENYMPSMEIRSKYTIFSEGCRGSLGKEVISKYNLDAGQNPQHYGIGIKEVWKISPEKHNLGMVIHSIGWPLSESKSGPGGFLYHDKDYQVSLGLFTDLSYSNAYVNPYEEMQRWKTHPKIRGFLEGAERVSYGARAVIKGGLQSLPKMSFPGGLLIGCDAGTLNMLMMKGIHPSMKSGIIAAEAVTKGLLSKGDQPLLDYDSLFKESWLHGELSKARNINPALHKFGTLGGSVYSFIDQVIFRGKAPWTFQDKKPDHENIRKICNSKKIKYPGPDGVLTFSRTDSVFLTNTNHEEDQPVHLKLTNQDIPIRTNLPNWGEPAQRYCPAGVYEVTVENNGESEFKINAQNCIHCKTCDIKDPSQNITWVPPEGGGGPNYERM